MFYARKITITAAAFLGLLLFTTCKKDPYLSIGDGDCFDPEEGYVDPLAPRFDVLPEYYYKNYHMPCFNPNNPKEFCYLFAKRGVGGQLRKHNLQTGEDKLIYPISFSGSPKWNKNGKITFASGYQVYTIDEDGKNIKKLTTIPYNMYPAWLNDTTIICYHSPNLANQVRVHRINTNSFKIDTLYLAARHFDVSNDGKVCVPAGGIILYSTPEVFQQHQWEYSIKVSDNLIDSRCAVWHPNCEDIFYTAYNEGLFKVNIYSKQNTLILPHCPSRRYSNLAISPDGNWIIAERLTYFYINPPPKRKVRKGKANAQLYQKYTLEIMDINGNNRMELKLPE
ncbi:MAG: hypothetical protein HJHJAOHD_01336 [Flavobacteriales bacterium]|nr:hypothetical protein [Flavobacteriales bacterium]WKZ75378.1 MAG: hypothetical protein QY303_00495 [Vicingaceae bacterium]